VSSKAILTILALVGFGIGIAGAHSQDRATKEAEAKLDRIGKLDEAIQNKADTLTALDRLGGGRYYVVLATFRHQSPRDDKDFAAVKGHLLWLFPDAEKNGLVWTQDSGKNQYELRFGRNLTLTSAEIFRQLAQEGHLSNGNALIRPEH